MLICTLPFLHFVHFSPITQCNSARGLNKRPGFNYEQIFVNVKCFAKNHKKKLSKLKVTKGVCRNDIKY